MEADRQKIDYPVVIPWSKSPTAIWLIIGLLTLVLFLPTYLLVYFSNDSGNAIGSFILGIVWFAACAYFLIEGLSIITITEERVTLSIGKYIRKQVATSTIRTVVKSRMGAKGDFYQLIILTVPAWELEAAGEKSLENGKFTGDEVKFQKGRPDWKDVCLEEGLLGQWGFRMEFTPRKANSFKESVSERRIPGREEVY